MRNGQRRELRSSAWFDSDDEGSFVNRAWMKAQGIPSRMFDGRPIIGICNTWSELAPCNSHLRNLAEHAKHGVYEAGGLPLEFPVMSLGETLMRPTSMLFRNLVSMDVEETIRANPIDGVVLLCGCDKTTPALLLGAASCDLPAIAVTGGPMLTGWFRGRRLGSGTSVFQMRDEVRADRASWPGLLDAESCLSSSAGHCNTMGTASTMAAVVEALGLGLPQTAAIPAMDSRRGQLAHDAGRRVVEMVREDLRMSRILTRPAFENAARVVAAVGGSTNSVIHLLALAGRIEVPFELTDFDLLTRDVPLLADVLPCGDHLMEDLFHAGGIPVVMRLLGDLIHRDALTVTGRTLGGEIGDAACWNPDVIRDPGHPVREEAGIAVLWGNLAPGGAVIKLAGASAELMRHRGRAVVFESVEDMRERIDSAVLDVDEAAVLVLRGAGPRGYPGMPEVGNLPLPRRLLARGVTDMLRISDARMSGTAAGTVVLHVTPESAAGGTLGLVRSGDVIEMDVAARRLTLDVPTAELERRRRAWVPPAVSARSGYERLFVDHVLQADRGVDFDFLVGCRGAGVPRINH